MNLVSSRKDKPMNNAHLNSDIIKELSSRDDLKFLVTDQPNKNISIYCSANDIDTVAS